MSNFGMFYHLLLITAVSLRFIVGTDDLTAETRRAKNDRIDTLARLQSLDRGDIAEPKIDAETLRSMSLDAVDNLVEEAHAQLRCSYLYFAMLHLYIVEMYMSNPKDLTNLSDDEINSLRCTNESAAILALVHDQDGQRWKDIRWVMWIFHMFTERTANFLRPFRTKSQVFNENSVVYDYNSVKVLLGEFSSTNGCKAYDSVNGTTEDYTVRLENIVIGDKRDAMLKALDNKRRFWRQAEHNSDSGWVVRDTDRFSLDHLLINNLLYNEQVMENLLTFGLSVKWEPIVRMVQFLHKKTINYTNYLSEYIQALGQFQLEYIRMLGNVAVQVVVKEMLRLIIKMRSMSLGALIMYEYSNCYNIGREIANQLTLFAEHVRLVDDRIFSQVIISTERSYLHAAFLIEKHLYNLLVELNEMYPNFTPYSINFLKVKKHEEIKTRAILAISRKNQLDVDFNMNNPELVQVFVKYIKKITSTIDFGIIESFKQLTASSDFKRFTEIEKEEVNKQL